MNRDRENLQKSPNIRWSASWGAPRGVVLSCSLNRELLLFATFPFLKRQLLHFTESWIQRVFKFKLNGSCKKGCQCKFGERYQVLLKLLWIFSWSRISSSLRTLSAPEPPSLTQDIVINWNWWKLNKISLHLIFHKEKLWQFLTNLSLTHKPTFDWTGNGNELGIVSWRIVSSEMDCLWSKTRNSKQSGCQARMKNR